MSSLAITTFESDKNPRGTRHAIAWGDLVSWFGGRFPAARPKASLPMWSPATFAGDARAAKNVELVSAMVFDVDEVPVPTLGEITAALQGVQWFAHSSSSALHGAPRWRLVVALSRPMNAAEHAHLWRAVTERLPFRVGQASKDPSRAWYWPREGADGSYEAGGSK